MKKYLWWGFAFCIMFLVVTGQHEHHSHDSASVNGNGQNPTVSSSDTPKAETDSENTNWYSEGWNVAYFVFGWPNGVTVWALFVTMIAIAEQSHFTRVAAEASNLNAQAVINAERPWLVADVKPVIGPMGGFTVSVFNKGRTPAMIVSYSLGCASAPDATTLPAKAPYGPNSPVIERIIMPNEEFPLTWFDSKDLKRLAESVGSAFKIHPWEGQVFVMGKILYRDLLHPDRIPTHETRRLGRYENSTENEGPSIFRFDGMGLPDEYEQYI